MEKEYKIDFSDSVVGNFSINCIVSTATTVGLMFVFLLFYLPAIGQVSITSSGTITESFDGFVGNQDPANWYIEGSGSRGATWNGTDQVNNNSGGWYGNQNMSFIGSGNASNGRATWYFRNDSGQEITGFTFSFKAKMHRNENASSQVSVTWDKKTTASNPSILWNNLNNLTFNDQTTNISNGIILTQTVTNISIPAGWYFFFRFTHPGGQFSDNLGWDDVSITPIFRPFITNISPAVASVGATVTITGGNFTGVSSVKFFNNNSAIYTVLNQNTITATVPQGAATGQISVTAAGGTAVGPVFTVTAPAYVFNKTGVASYTVANNWTPNRDAPLNTDVLIFDDGGNIEVAEVPDEIIGKILVKGNTNVTFQAQSPCKLTVKGGFGAITVESGSSLDLGVAGNLTTEIDNTSSIIVDGILNVSKTLNIGPNPVTGTGVFNVLPDATLEIEHPQGISNFGAVGNVQSNGRNFSTQANYSYVGNSMQSTGIGLPYEVQSLTISNPAGVNLTSSVDVRNTLTLVNGEFSIGQNELALYNPVKGTTTNLVGGTLSSIRINGTASAVNVPASVSFLRSLEIDNPNGTTLQGPLVIEDMLLLTNGIVYSKPYSTLRLNAAMVYGGSSTSYVDGPVQRTYSNTVSVPKFYPVGEDNVYRPIVIDLTHDNADQNIYQVELMSPMDDNTVLTGGGLKHVSVHRFWRMTGVENSSKINQRNVTMYWFEDDGVVDPNDVRVAFRGASPYEWEALPFAGAFGDQYQGFVQGTDNTNRIGDFALGSYLGVNPLPVDLISFDATVKDEDVVITWKTASELNNDRFEVERSADGSEFKAIDVVKTDSKSNSVKNYESVDRNPFKGTSYYRLKQVDLDGTVAYSKTVAVSLEKNFVYVDVYPNPSTAILNLKMDRTIDGGELRIINTVGQVVKTETIQEASSKIHRLDVSDLPAGSYTLLVDSGDDQIYSRFIKK